MSSGTIISTTTWRLEGTPNGIAALVQAHEKYAGGATDILYVDDDLYIMQRTGYGEDAGLIYVLNNSGDELERKAGHHIVVQCLLPTRGLVECHRHGAPDQPVHRPRWTAPSSTPRRVGTRCTRSVNRAERCEGKSSVVDTASAGRCRGAHVHE